ncbi:hypothetical protein [Sphingobacterium suaedae]|uniref:Homing endonuclease LAGLIDADG domain-containing protein n=1 Tax=Sphingobacterium suaedae TaxID=1686402 RepID=A0ABW5KLF2_9SPHI
MHKENMFSGILDSQLSLALAKKLFQDGSRGEKVDYIRQVKAFRLSFPTYRLGKQDMEWFRILRCAFECQPVDEVTYKVVKPRSTPEFYKAFATWDSCR